MLKKLFVCVALLVIAILGYAATRPNHFRYERSGLINATPAVIFPYLNSFKLGSQWSPWEKVDPNMKKTYSGPDAGPGAMLAFAGNSEAGEGKLQILKSETNSVVDLQLEMIKPFAAINFIQYKLTPEASGTRFTWTMYGEANFLSKLVGVFIDCGKMIQDKFAEGIANLTRLTESKPAA